MRLVYIVVFVFVEGFNFVVVMKDYLLWMNIDYDVRFFFYFNDDVLIVLVFVVDSVFLIEWFYYCVC